MIRALKVMAIGGLAALLAACSGGGGGGGDTTAVGALKLELFAISPASGVAPLQTSLTAVVSGGVAPYDYAWDFENDGSFDAFDNNKFDTTVSRQHQYNLRAADAGGSSVYTGKVRITDSAGTVLTSDPATVTVTDSTPIVPVDSAFIEDELGNQIDPESHNFASGEALRFHFGDSANFTYQWDFDYQQIDPSKPADQQVTPQNPTFTVQSTAVNPSHVFYNTGSGPITHIVLVRVKDVHTGEVASHSFHVTIEGTEPTGGDSTLDADISSDPAADSNGVITLRYDPTGGTPGIPTEPMLELSAVVSTEPGKSGVPPYEFYWDFENDGKIDRAASSPTIPYYDSQRKVTVNPYLHNEDEHIFQVRLLVLDIKGHSDEVIKTIRSINVGNRPPAALSFTTNWGFGVAPNLLPFVEVDGAGDGTHTGTFTIVPKGATGFYEYKLDVDGDGKGDYDYVDTNADTVPDTAKLVPGADKWIPVSLTGTTISVPFGPHPDPDDQNNPPATVNQFPVPNYYPVQAIVRALSAPGGNQVDAMTRQMPVSLVQVGSTSNETIDVDSSDPDVDQLPAIQDQQMVPFAHTNGGVLTDRGVVIVGGAQGTTALRDVTRITQTFNPPAQPGDIEALSGGLVEQLTPLTVARRGHTSFLHVDSDMTDKVNVPATAVVYSVGGHNPGVGPLASVEFMPFDLSRTDQPWLLSGTEMNPTGSAYPLFDFGNAMTVNFTFSDNSVHPGYLFAGGLNQPAKNANANVSSLTARFFGLAESNPADDFWGTQGGSLGVPRYDLSTVAIGTTLYAIGGRSSSGQSTATVEKFDLNNDNSWVQLPNMHDPRAGCNAEVIDPDGSGPLAPQIYVYGGAYFPGIAGNRTLVQTAEVYNPATQTWSYTLPPTTSTYAAGSAALAGPGSVDATVETKNTIWYYGGEIGQTASAGETNKLEEFIYFYNNQ